MRLKLPIPYKAFARKKPIENCAEVKSGLAKCLSTLDLTALGIGSTLGVGAYVLAGMVAKDLAGPAVIISFAIAAVASMIAGLCYAEFGTRVPKAGSVYVYSYVTVGEFIAFFIGWTLILEYVIGAASVIKILSRNVDEHLLSNYTQDTLTAIMPIHTEYLGDYPDFLASFITLVFSAVLAFGTKESSLANNIFTVANVGILLFVVISGVFKVDFNNWRLSPQYTENNCKRGTGGFMPFGIAGVLKGAAKCFYAFIGFDCVATTGEEARNPQRSIPIAIVASIIVVFIAYFGVSSVLTTVMPYYDLDKDNPFVKMFDAMGWGWGGKVVLAGTIFALCTSTLGALFPLPRIIYAMASDGLIFKWMGQVHPRFQTPLYGTIFAGILTGFLTTILKFERLMDMMSIGTLLAYSIVASCVLILRYEESKSSKKRENNESFSVDTILSQLVNSKGLTSSTKLTSRLVNSLVLFFCINCLVLTFLIEGYSTEIMNGNIFLIALVVIFIAAAILILIFIYLQPICDKHLIFAVPCVPFLPGISILINFYLMMTLDKGTWIGFMMWMGIGSVVYFLYGIRNSTLNQYLPANSLKMGSVSNVNGVYTTNDPNNDGNVDNFSRIEL